MIFIQAGEGRSSNQGQTFLIQPFLQKKVVSKRSDLGYI